MRDFITIAITITIATTLVLMFWLFYTLPLYIVWNYVVTPIFDCSTLSMFEAFMMMMGLNIIYIIVSFIKAPHINNNIEL